MSVNETEFRLLQERVDRHISECDEERKVMRDSLTKGSMQFNEITGKLDSLITNTQGLIEFDRNLRGAINTGVTVRKFLIWLASLGAAGAVVAYYTDLGIEYLKEVLK